MHPVLRRIAIHGTLAAIILAAIGLLFAELASIWLASGPARTPGGSVEVSVDVDIADALRRRVPLRMALVGLAIVAVGETLLYVLRKPAVKAPAAPPRDDAEKLLEQLLAEAESRASVQAVPSAGHGNSKVEPQPQPQA